MTENISVKRYESRWAFALDRARAARDDGFKISPLTGALLTVCFYPMAAFEYACSFDNKNLKKRLDDGYTTGDRII